MVDSGIILLKYWLEVSPEEQTRRLESRINDPRKVWKLSDMDLRSYGRWYDYSRARDEMFRATDTSWAPWYVAHTDDKKRGRLNVISHLLSAIPYTPAAAPGRGTTEAPEAPRLPRRQPIGAADPDAVLNGPATLLSSARALPIGRRRSPNRHFPAVLYWRLWRSPPVSAKRYTLCTSRLRNG